jgi:iron(III) transport system ATP-binding protein
MTTPLRVQNLVKTYGDEVAVDDVSFDVESGNTLVLLGPSGCGKTSILRSIAGLERIASGTITIDGTVASGGRVHLDPEDRPVGMVFQSYALWPHMTVLGNVMFSCARQARLKKSEAQARAKDLLHRFGLSAMADRRPAELSGGQQQRVALARAIGGNPALLLMDEPLSALDPQLRDALRVELRTTIAETGLACVYVTHDQREALAMADHVAVLNRGRICELAPPTDIYARPRTAFGASFLGSTNSLRSAKVLHPGAPGRWVAESDGIQVDFTPTPGWTPVTGDLADVLWRPEATRLYVASADEPSRPNAWAVRTRTSVFAGTGHEVLVETAGGQRLLAVADTAWPVGAECLTTTDSEDITGYAVTHD